MLSRPGWHPSLAESAGKPEAGRAAVDTGQRGQGLGPRVGGKPLEGQTVPRMSLSPRQPFLPRLLGQSGSWWCERLHTPPKSAGPLAPGPLSRRAM